MSTGNFVFDNAWILFIIVTVFNAFYIKIHSQKYIAKQPNLQEGYDKLFKGYLTYLNVPWVVMGIGILVGGVPSTFSFIAPPIDINIFVLAFYASIVILWTLSIWWIYFNGGAEFLIKHPGVFSQNIQTPMQVKVFFGLSLTGGILGLFFILGFNGFIINYTK